MNAIDSIPTANSREDGIRPSRVNVPKSALDDLHKRLLATRWPTKELVNDRSQGVQAATMRELVRYWSSEYDWREVEARLNALPQFTTKIDGVDIHFIHVKSRHENALPLIMTHGWPGSVIELLDSVGPLTAISQKLAALESWTAPAIHDAVNQTATELAVGMGKVAQPIRVAVSGTSVSPPIDATLDVLGRETTLSRLAAAVAYVQSGKSAA